MDDEYDEEEGTWQHFCDECDKVRTFEEDDGCFFCMECGTETLDIMATAKNTDYVFDIDDCTTESSEDNEMLHLGMFVDDEDTQEHFCENCNIVRTFEEDVGLFFCTECGAQKPDLIATGIDTDDILGMDGCGTGALYSHRLHRRLAPEQEPANNDGVNRDVNLRDFGATERSDIDIVARYIELEVVEDNMTDNKNEKDVVSSDEESAI